MRGRYYAIHASNSDRSLLILVPTNDKIRLVKVFDRKTGQMTEGGPPVADRLMMVGGAVGGIAGNEKGQAATILIDNAQVWPVVEKGIDTRASTFYACQYRLAIFFGFLGFDTQFLVIETACQWFVLADVGNIAVGINLAFHLQSPVDSVERQTT